jgi:3',5'-cyclic AMP phosphodiesterase CpdA
MSDRVLSAIDDGTGFSRRGFLKGAVGIGLAAGFAGLADGGFFYEDASAAPDPGITTLPLPTTTAPEQLHLQWGSDPATSVTVSWVAPGSVAQPAPKLAYSIAPITAQNPGKVVQLPPPAPLDVTRPRRSAAAISFADGLSGFTTYHYHVQLTDLDPDTTYYYEVADGAASPSVIGSSFTTAPVGRAKYRFSSYGDMGTPTSSSPINVTGIDWVEGNDTCVFEVDAVENPGDGLGAPLFHLLNGDLCYANLDPANTPSVWRDFGVNVARSAANRPWMPCIGNHENEFGICDRAGHPFPGPIGEAGAAGSYWNGPYGDGHYLARFLLPDNQVVNHDGNRLQGAFYKFQVGTVLFVALDADDVIYQQNDNAGPGAGNTFQSGASIPAGLLANSREYTGTLGSRSRDNSLVPAGPNPNVQTAWLERTLAEGRRDPSVDMIVVFMHQPAVGGTPDLGIRQAWAPLFDRHQVDLVLHGHAHLYERSYPVRGYDPPSGTVTTAFDGYAVGDTIDTRRPTVVTTEPAMVNGTPAWNTAEGTVYVVVGGGGASSSLPYGFDSADGLRQAGVVVTLNGTDAVEDAPWSAGRDPGDAHGYAIFDVDPGRGWGETTITMKWFAIPTVANGQTIPLPTTPLETHIFGRKVPVVRSGHQGHQEGRPQPVGPRA